MLPTVNLPEPWVVSVNVVVAIEPPKAAVAAVETLRGYFGKQGSEAEKAACKALWTALYEEATS